MKFEQRAEVKKNKPPLRKLLGSALSYGVLYRRLFNDGPGNDIYFVEYFRSGEGVRDMIVDVGVRGLSCWEAEHFADEEFIEVEENTEVVIKLCGVKKQET
jgi:hypothetical protein